MAAVITKQPGPLVLVVDDEKLLLDLVSMILTHVGFQTLRAGSPSEALRVWEECGERIEIALLDVVMPQISGPDLGWRLQREKPGLKILVMSGNATEDIHSPFKLVEGVNFLRKPFQAKALIALMEKALQECQAPLAR